MKFVAPLLLLTISFQASTAVSQLIFPNIFRKTPAKFGLQQQKPIMNIPNILVPPSKDDEGSSGGSDGLSISDVIGKERVINIFAGFTRDIDTISKRLNDNEQNTTVLAPLNSALQKLPRKPWEDPEDYEELGTKAYEGASGEDRATRNLRRFAEAHIVPVSPWKEGEKVKSMGGGQVWWEKKDGNKVVRCLIVIDRTFIKRCTDCASVDSTREHRSLKYSAACLKWGGMDCKRMSQLRMRVYSRPCLRLWLYAYE